MDLQNPKNVEKILLEKIYTVETGLLTAYPNNGLKQHLKTGSHYNGNGRVESFLSFRPEIENAQSIDLVFALSCTAKGAVFSSEIAWSDGKVIDEVVVCEVCPECDEQLGERVDHVTGDIQQLLVKRMVELVGNFA